MGIGDWGLGIGDWGLGNQSVHIVKQLPKDPSAEFMACVDTDKRNASAV